jgi:hypothetical protein
VRDWWEDLLRMAFGIYRWIVGHKGALSERAELYNSKGGSWWEMQWLESSASSNPAYREAQRQERRADLSLP